ncbi:AfsR/SARP family transcriptional regulator [Antricoccus suffuscus]|uniref:AfsR/SARP family transcriptional regulator n=1 Tax=Antricoccus suffuscus TaxID=1629062 RepID=UPI00192D48C5|nr:AfsR/SARP family transcriptional regulator [Antricoccus suffuscus]
MIADLWDEDRLRDPAHALQAQVSRLRSTLPIEIEFLHGGYRVDPTTFRTDAARFERLYKQSRWLLADGDLNQAADCLHEALGLWRGDALEGLHAVAALHIESVRLAKLHAAALADRIDVDLALERGAAMVPELHVLVEEQPFLERHWGQLMTALYSGGNTHEALETFSRARGIFVEHLGVEPSGELCGLHMQILREEPPESLLRLPTASTARGEPGNTDDIPRDTSALSVTSNRPSALLSLLDDKRALILTGPAGIGKTHLLRTLAATFESQHRLAPLLSASPLSKTIPLGVFLGTAGSIPEDRFTPAALIDFFTRQRSQAVLLVDNVDQLDDTSLFVITALIRTSGLPAVMTIHDLNNAPQEITALYDSGELSQVAVEGLTAADVDELAIHMVGGPLTPDTRPRILEIASGNPLHLREIITGSLHEGRLAHTVHGWELQGTPTPTSRLARLVGERFDVLNDAALEAAASVAIAGEYPADALDESDRRALARADVLEFTEHGWLRLSHPLDAEILRARCSDVLWHELTRDVVQVLLEGAQERPEARRRAHVLALDLNEEIDPEATIALAEHALASFDERLALRAAEAVVARMPASVDGHRIAAQAASALRMSEVADEHFGRATENAVTGAERTAVALARGCHLGLVHHDAAEALKIINEALTEVDGPIEVAHLQRARTRWAAVAGQGGEVANAPAEASDAASALGMITVGVSGVITGPLEDAQRVLLRLREVPDDIIDLVPGGAALIELTEIMALSNTGDVIATRRRLEETITQTTEQAPEALGMWEYALGFSHLLSGDSKRAYEIGQSAAAHLAWRDAAGLLPAAQALAAAAAQANGRTTEARKLFDAVPAAAAHDPKVVMLRAWADAWQAKTERRDGDAAHTLINAAQWMLAAQHTFFAGMLAHCAVRVGAVGGGEQLSDAVTILHEAEAVAGGGLLDIFVRHGEATLAGDHAALDLIAGDAHELGMESTATDTWQALLRSSDETSLPASKERHLRRLIGRVHTEAPTMVLWTALAS